MKNRINISTGTKWENQIGYSRLVRAGNLIFVTGTVAIDDDHNISGMTDNGTGDYSFAIDRDMANTTYVAVGGPGDSHTSFGKMVPTDAGNVQFLAFDHAGTARDHGVLMMLIIGEN